MLKFLAQLEGFYGPFRMFESITFRSALALFLAFGITLLTGKAFIKALSNLGVLENVQKPDSERLEELHKNKQNTPSMGGIIIVIAILLATVLCADPGNNHIVLAIYTLLSFAGLGFVDDYVKLRGIGKHRGLSRIAKLVIQVILAGMLWMALREMGDKEFLTKLLVPGTKMKTFLPDLGGWYVGFFIIVVVGCSNAVNLTDGLDGLAAGSTVLVASTFTILAYVVGHSEISEFLRIPHVNFSGELAVFCSAMIGATLGFLWFNSHPAQVFMGDTGSLALGASIAFVALAIKQEAVLLVAGGIFVWEAASVIIQMISYKFFGKRVFRCSPFHHHLEFSGWNENHIVVRLWCLGIILSVLALATLKMH
ncbi:MAG: phospho-N-acetylmuramoyl-pentapeptide-transferase [Planctomycetes bacterium]|nr:phospho-N-acetylmuramoyl-pentapeptide-transferase [Planctomycetota bacterium]